MANQSFELIEFPVSQTLKAEKTANALFAASVNDQSDLFRYMVGHDDEICNEIPRVTVRIYVVNPEGKPAIRIQL